MSTVSGALELTNDSTHELHVVLEPWGDEWHLAPNAALKLAYEGPSGGDLAVVYGERRITVHGWVGSTVSAVLTEPAPPT